MAEWNIRRAFMLYILMDREDKAEEQVQVVQLLKHTYIYLVSYGNRGDS